MATKTLSKKEWKELEESITFYNSEKLLIDGKEISIHLDRQSKMKLQYMIYIDGWFKGEYLKEGNPIREKYYFRKSKQLYKKSVIKEMEKIGGKRWAKKRGYSLENKYHYYVPCFSSFRTMKNTFENNNESIEIIKEQI